MKRDRKPEKVPVPITEAQWRAELKAGGWPEKELREWPPLMAKFDAEWCAAVNGVAKP